MSEKLLFLVAKISNLSSLFRVTFNNNDYTYNIVIISYNVIKLSYRYIVFDIAFSRDIIVIIDSIRNSNY